MKTAIHPKYFTNAKYICACGNTFTAGATQEEIHTEICGACHPFYTGKQKLIDTTGAVDKFKKRVAAKAAPKVKKERKTRTKK